MSAVVQEGPNDLQQTWRPASIVEQNRRFDRKLSDDVNSVATSLTDQNVHTTGILVLF
ncbi:Hypothetical predicted protein [Cloeon dipterum]|uniref:Uncharacterized protein n=1 Tax=Cloeon dipterum TaxID=197152 RepID=A0A8S1DWQ8_9INSE|nr:Hypothetical predicted protein [Cloeon dipterum]